MNTNPKARQLQGDDSQSFDPEQRLKELGIKLFCRGSEGLPQRTTTMIEKRPLFATMSSSHTS
jgi:hypothetical protein